MRGCLLSRGLGDGDKGQVRRWKGWKIVTGQIFYKVWGGDGQAPSMRPWRSCGPKIDPGRIQLGFFDHHRVVENYPHVALNLGFNIFE